jgi:type I restriction enzyme S subunit
MNASQTLLTEHIDIWTAAETEKKTGRGRTSGNACSVYGIKKLRELILELAVRGKLVPQDTNDEPASELLKRIQAEKAKLIAAGKIKKDKELVEAAEEKKPFGLPNGWAYSRLGDAIEIIRGITFPGSEKTKKPETGRVACLRTTNVQDQIEWEDLLYIREEFVTRTDQFLMPRDIVMSMANSRELVGKVALVGTEIHQKTSFGGFLGVLRPFLIEPRFVMALLRTPHTREALIDSASQTTNIANISLAKLRPLFFAIPPLKEQHRIVAKVDELMALCDELEAQHANAADAHEKLVRHLLGTLTQSQDAVDFNANWQRIAAHFDTLFTTEASIDALKQTLLQLAVMGKLVPQDANDEPSSELLERIQNEKVKLIAEGKIRKEKALPPLTLDKVGSSLPHGWERTNFGEIIELISGQHLNPSEYFETFEKGSIPYITGPADFGVDGPVPTRHTFERRALSIYGDILVTVKGSGVGKTNTVYQNELAISRQLMAVRPISINVNFIEKLLLTLATLFQELTVGIAIPGISREDILHAEIVLPPLAEQHRIVVKVDELMTLCDQLKSHITQANRLQKNLTDVMVEQAVTS